MDLRSGRSCRFQAFNSQVLAERLDAQACRSRCRAEHVKSDGQQTLAAVCVGSSVENVFVADLVGVRKDCCSYQVPLTPPYTPVGSTPFTAPYTPLSPLTPPYQDQSCCPWLGLQQSTTTMGAGAHWDLWDADCSSRYTNWNEGEPNDDPKTGGDENCACISAEGEDNTWFDVPCYMPAACVREQVGGAALVVPTAHTPWPPGADSLGTWLRHPLSGSSGRVTAVRLWAWPKSPNLRHSTPRCASTEAAHRRARTRTAKRTVASGAGPLL